MGNIVNGRGLDTGQKSSLRNDPRNHADFIWTVADLLRGDYEQSEYGKVILPLTVLHRLDGVLAPTKQRVLEMHKQLRGKLEKMDSVFNRITGVQFNNTSELDLRRVLDDPPNVAEQLRRYVAGFSGDVRDVFEKFDLDAQIARLDASNLLYLVLGKFVDIVQVGEGRAVGAYQLLWAHGAGRQSGGSRVLYVVGGHEFVHGGQVALAPRLLEEFAYESFVFSSADMRPPPLHIANSRFLRRVGIRDNATCRAPTHRPKAYSPKCLERECSDVRMLFLCRGADTALEHSHKPYTMVCYVYCGARLTPREFVGSLPALLLDRG